MARRFAADGFGVDEQVFEGRRAIVPAEVSVPLTVASGRQWMPQEAAIENDPRKDGSTTARSDRASRDVRIIVRRRGPPCASHACGRGPYIGSKGLTIA